MTAKEMLHTEAAMWRKLYEGRGECPASFKEWLVEHGEEFGPAIRIRGLPLMKKKECYSNSMKTVLNWNVDTTEWFYTEGVVLTDGLPILIDHAWLSNAKGEVLDRTLRSQKAATYFGIPFDNDYAIEQTMKHGYYGLFSNGCMYNPNIVGKPMTDHRAWAHKGERKHVEAT